MSSTPTCAGCGDALSTSTNTCEACGNNPRRSVRTHGLIVGGLAIPAFVISPPIGIILAIVAGFAFVGSLFVSAEHQATAGSEAA